jgi:hypothetical protein
MFCLNHVLQMLLETEVRLVGELVRVRTKSQHVDVYFLDGSQVLGRLEKLDKVNTSRQFGHNAPRMFGSWTTIRAQGKAETVKFTPGERCQHAIQSHHGRKWHLRAISYPASVGWVYGWPERVMIISGIAAMAATVISTRIALPTMVSNLLLTCLPMTFLSAATRRIG